DLARGVKAGVRDLVKDGVVALVADAREHRGRALANPARERVVVEPGEVVDGAAAADDDDGVRQATMVARDGLESFSGGSEDIAGGAIALEARVRVDEGTDAVPVQAVGVGAEVAEAGGLCRRDDEDELEI